MKDENGRIKVRVLRYDAPKSNIGKPITFASGLPLWQFREGSSYATSTKIDLSPCQLNEGIYRQVAPGAFMINNIDDLKKRSSECEQRLIQALSQAVGNETCADYVLGGSKKKGQYRIKFVPCEADTCQ